MQEGKAANERRKLILEAVDTFIKIHDDWEADMKGPVQPTERFERALKLAVEVCDHGDTPQDCRRLVAAIAKMGTEWLLYENGKHVSDIQGDMRPVKQFWDAVREVKMERTGAAPFQPRKRESVALLLKQNVSPEQIARFIYADPEWPNGYGPFLGTRNEVNYQAIEQEAAHAGSVLPPDYVHYDDRARLRADEESLRTRLTQLQEERDRVPSKEDPEQLLRDGQYANVVSNVCGISMDEVMEIANRLGIKPEMTPNLASERSPREPAINEFAARAMDATVMHVIDEGGDEPTVETPEQQVIRMAAEGLNRHQIASNTGLKIKEIRAILESQGVAQ